MSYPAHRAGVKRAAGLHACGEAPGFAAGRFPVGASVAGRPGEAITGAPAASRRMHSPPCAISAFLPNRAHAGSVRSCCAAMSRGMSAILSPYSRRRPDRRARTAVRTAYVALPAETGPAGRAPGREAAAGGSARRRRGRERTAGSPEPSAFAASTRSPGQRPAAGSPANAAARCPRPRRSPRLAAPSAGAAGGGAASPGHRARRPPERTGDQRARSRPALTPSPAPAGPAPRWAAAAPRPCRSPRTAA